MYATLARLVVQLSTQLRTDLAEMADNPIRLLILELQALVNLLELELKQRSLQREIADRQAQIDNLSGVLDYIDRITSE